MEVENDLVYIDFLVILVLVLLWIWFGIYFLELMFWFRRIYLFLVNYEDLWFLFISIIMSM